MKSTLQEKNKTKEEDIVIIKNSTFTDSGENKPSGNVVKTLATFVTFSMISVGGNAVSVPIEQQLSHSIECQAYKNIEFPIINNIPMKSDMVKYTTMIDDISKLKISLNTLDVTVQQHIYDLRKENTMLRTRLSKSLPIHTITYLIITGSLISCSLLLILLQFIKGIYIFRFYTLFCALLIGLTLFFTALVSLKDWKEFLNER